MTTLVQLHTSTTLAQITRIVPKLVYTVLKKFSQFTIFEQLALALKNRVVLKLFIVLNILFTYRIFEQLALQSGIRGKRTHDFFPDI